MCARSRCLYIAMVGLIFFLTLMIIEFGTRDFEHERFSENLGFISANDFPPEIYGPDDFTIEYGSSGEITWTHNASDSIPYDILLNGTGIQSGISFRTAINTTLSELDLGLHNYTLVLTYSGSNTVSDTVLVSVIDTTYPQISPQNNIEIVEGDNPPVITWTISDLDPQYWELLLNGTASDSAAWNESPKVIQVQTSANLGVYNYTVIARDNSGNTAHDTVIFTVKPDIIPPSISSPTDLAFFEGSSAVTITWEVSDDHPVSYQILRNGIEHSSGSWDGSNISLRLTSTLAIGTYNYTLVVWDIHGNSVSDSIIITIAWDYRPVLFLGIVTASGSIVLIVIAIASIMALRRRKRLQTLQELLQNKKSIPINSVVEGTSSDLETVISVIEKADFAALTMDKKTIVNIDLFVDDISTHLIHSGELNLTEETKKWDIEVQEAQSFIKDRFNDVYFAGDNKVLLKKPILQEIFTKLDDLGFVETTLIAQEKGISKIELMKDIRARTRPGQPVIEEVGLVAKDQWVSMVRSKVTEIGFVNLESFSRELHVSKKTLDAVLATYVSGKFDEERENFTASVFRPEPAIRRRIEPLVEVLRGGEFIGNRLKYKVKAVNNSDYVVTDVTVTLLSYPRDSLRLEGDPVKTIPKIDPKGFRSPSFDFLPTQDCVKGDITASVSYIDQHGRAHSITTEPYTIRAVCDLLRPETISPEEFELRLSKLDHGEMKLKVEDWTPEEMHSKAVRLLRESNFSEVTSSLESIGEHIESKIRGWAKGKYTEKNIGIQITITGKPGIKGATCKVHISGEDEAMIMPAIDEITQKLAAWLCPICSGSLPAESVVELKAGESITCPFCGVTISR